MTVLVVRFETGETEFWTIGGVVDVTGGGIIDTEADGAVVNAVAAAVVVPGINVFVCGINPNWFVLLFSTFAVVVVPGVIVVVDIFCRLRGIWRIHSINLDS